MIDESIGGLEALYTPAEHQVILRLDQLAAIWNPTGGPVTVPVTQEELAMKAGAARPTANRALRELAASGAIELARGRTIIVDRGLGSVDQPFE